MLKDKKITEEQYKKGLENAKTLENTKKAKIEFDKDLHEEKQN